MDITTVEYRRLATHGEYENTTVGATARVQEGEMPGMVLEKLQDWVNSNLEAIIKDKDVSYELKNSVSGLEYQKSALKREISKLKAEHDQLRKILSQHGVNLEEPPYFTRDDYEAGIPF